MPYIDKTKKKKVVTKDMNFTLRKRWSKGGGSADIRMTTKLLEAICDKIGLE